MTQRALITGITGQDGSYLADILLERGWDVHGLYRHTSTGNLSRIRHLEGKITLHQGDMVDPTSVHRIIASVRPSVIFNEADQDNVGWSFNSVGLSMEVTAGAVARTLESVRQIDPSVRFFQPASATMFGMAPPPQSEETPLDPRSPYACAKACAYHLARHYRREHGMFVSTAILYNHDSPRRGGDYLLQSICRQAVAVARGRQEAVRVGRDVRVDIGYAREYMEAICDMMELDAPDDFVIATGQGCTVGQMVAEALRQCGVMECRLQADSALSPREQPDLTGNCRKALAAFGFEPRTYVYDLIAMLVKHFQENT